MSWISARIQELQREGRKRRISAGVPPLQAPDEMKDSSGQVLIRSKELTLLLESRRGGRLLELSDR